MASFRMIRSAMFLLLASLYFETGFALPRPDFGVAPEVVNSARVAQRASSLRTSFDALDNFSVNINSGYELLVLIRDIFIKISGQLSTTGMTLADRIVALANDDTGPIATSFAQVNQAASDLNALLNGGLDAELATLTQRLDSSLSNQFRDAFQQMTSGVRALSQALGTLQGGLTKAKVAAGASAVTVPLVRRFVSASMVNNVLAALDRIGASMPLVSYIVNTTVG